jgi:mRNA-degrading endonuclease RelE of RelBE toxin-antitoxin system
MTTESEPASDRHHLEYGKRATKDMRKIPRKDRERIGAQVAQLGKIPPAANLDLDKIRRQEPWLRLRVGNFRVLFRQLTRGEMDVLCLRRGTLAGATGFLIGRVVDKQDVERAIDTLDLIGLDSPV